MSSSLHNRGDTWLVRVGTGLIAFLFFGGAVQKASSPGDSQVLLAAMGAPAWLVWPAMGFNLLAGLALFFQDTRLWAAIALAAYCLVTSLFHLHLGGAWQVSIAVKNWAIAGGLLILAGHVLQKKGSL